MSEVRENRDRFTDSPNSVQGFLKLRTFSWGSSFILPTCAHLPFFSVLLPYLQASFLLCMPHIPGYHRNIGTCMSSLPHVATSSHRV